jgi:hypothetical protein
MKTTVDVVIRCFFNPGCAGSIMTPDSFESIIWDTIPAAPHYPFGASIDAA